MSDWRQNRILGLTYGEFTWLAAGLALLIYEVWAVITRDGDVLTRAYRAHTSRWMFLPLGFGVLAGHLHGPTIRNVGAGLLGHWSPAILIVLGVAVLARDFLIGSRFPVVWVFPLFVLGVALGVTQWIGRP